MARHAKGMNGSFKNRLLRVFVSRRVSGPVLVTSLALAVGGIGIGASAAAYADAGSAGSVDSGPVQIGPYYRKADGSMSELGRHIRILTNNGKGDGEGAFKDANFTGDWRKTTTDAATHEISAAPDGLHVWQSAENVTQAKLKVCVVNPAAQPRQGESGCLPAGSGDNDGYEVSTTSADAGNWPSQSSPKLSDTMDAIDGSGSAENSVHYVYVKLGENITENMGTTDAPETETFAKGSVVKIPVVHDVSAPDIEQVSADEPASDGAQDKAIDFADAGQVSLSNGTLRTGGSGIAVHVRIHDTWSQGASNDADVAGVSGPKKLSLQYHGHAVTSAQQPVCTAEPASKGPAFDEIDCRFSIDKSYLGNDTPKFGKLGSVDLNDFSMQAIDNMGNASVPQKLGDVQPFSGVVGAIEFYAFPKATDVDLAMAIGRVNGDSTVPVCGPNQSKSCKNGRIVRAAQVVVSPVVSAKAASWYSSLAAFRPRISYSWSNQSGSSGASQCEGDDACGVSSEPVNEEKPTLDEGTYSVEYNISYANAGGLPSMIADAIGAGNEVISSSLSGLCVDGTAPSVTVDSQYPQGNWLEDNSYTDGSGADAVKVATSSSGKSFTYTVCAKEYLHSSNNTACLADANDEAGTSGMKELSLTYQYYRNYDDAIKAVRGDRTATHPVTKTVAATSDNKNTIALPIHDDGAYLVSSMKVTAHDKAGNGVTNQPLTRISTFRPDCDVIVFDGQRPGVKSATITLNDAKGTPASDSPYYHRGSVSAKLTITDKWFEAANQLPHHGGRPFAATLCAVDIPQNQDRSCPDGSTIAAASQMADAVQLSQFVRALGSDDTWVADNVRMPSSSVPGETRSAEGAYSLRLHYAPIGHPVDSSDSTMTDTSRFCIDYSNPRFGAVSYSITKPDQWGWIFAAGDETISVKASDAVSGVNDARSAFDGQWSKAPHTPDTLTSSNGQIGVTFGSDSQRLTLAGSVVTVRDKAGNESKINLGKSLPLQGRNHYVTGIAIDKETPAISVAYDNNSVRNGKYYKANRHATVTVSESNFDFIRNNDQWRTVIRSAVDGNAGTSVAAKDFKNENGDGKTWTAVLPCERDGDWAVDVGLTDPAGHVAAPYHGDFTIDTVKPLLNITFDNNSAESGNYYKAARHAVIKQTERNFSSADTVVSVGAKDASGAVVDSPTPSPWSGADRNYARTSNVDFNHELHYTLKVQATDLAGNVAEAVEEPEFVIDMTKPRLAISDVSDKTAYAGNVTPKIDYSDTNLDPMLADYTLTRTHKPGDSPNVNAKETKGKAENVYVKSDEHADATSKAVAFSDIEHTVDNDDVYTLTATVRDKAGNKSRQKVVYSLNRFGSDYVLDGATQNSLGKYIKAPHDVRVTEINVSGLDSAKSHMELVHDQNVKSLEAAKDYRLTRDNSSGWQMVTYDFPAKLFADDGYYRLQLASVDAAGNLSQNTMGKKNELRNHDAQIDFAVDGQAPQARIGGLNSRSVFYSPSHDFVADAKDDVALKSVEMKIDGKSVGKWKGDSTLSPMSYRFNADQKRHKVELIATDMAGNTTVSDYNNVVVASSWWAYAMARGFLLPGIAAAIIMLAFIIVAIALVVRHRKQTAYRRNVFER